MAKKDKEIPVAEEKPQVNLIPCTVVMTFTDGNMVAAFGEYGYGVKWERGEKRFLPMWLIERVQQSGGEVEFLRG